MLGHSKPYCPQIHATALAIEAFAICTQFLVTGKSRPCTAATAVCAVSVAAFRGMIPEANPSTSGVMSSSGISRITSNLSRAATVVGGLAEPPAFEAVAEIVEVGVDDGDNDQG